MPIIQCGSRTGISRLTVYSECTGPRPPHRDWLIIRIQELLRPSGEPVSRRVDVACLDPCRVGYHVDRLLLPRISPEIPRPSGLVAPFAFTVSDDSGSIKRDAMTWMNSSGLFYRRVLFDLHIFSRHARVQQFGANVTHRGIGY